MKTPTIIKSIVLLLITTLARAGNDQIALQRTARMYEIFQELIYPEAEDSATGFYMLDIGIGGKFSTNKAETDLIAKNLANQSLFVHGIKGDGKENTKPRAEVISLTPFSAYYSTFIHNHKTPQPTAEQKSEMDRLTGIIQALCQETIKANNARIKTIGEARANLYQGNYTSDEFNSIVASANDLYTTHAAVKALNEAKQELNHLKAQLGGAIWRYRQNKTTAAESAEWPVTTIPSIQQLNDEDGWVSHDLTTKSLKLSSAHSETTVSVGGSGWFFSANGSYKKVTSDDDKLIDDMILHFKIKRISCYREWLDLGAFGDTSYDPIKPKAEMPVLSSGQLLSNGYYGGDGTPQSGVCPFVVLDMIFVKDVVLEAPWKHEHTAFVSEAMSGSASYGFGPFRIGGGGSRKWDRTDATSDEANHKISITTPQLIGYIAFKLPACPVK